jgi:hypothetical protein
MAIDDAGSFFFSLRLEDAQAHPICSDVRNLNARRIGGAEFAAQRIPFGALFLQRPVMCFGRCCGGKRVGECLHAGIEGSGA